MEHSFSPAEMLERMSQAVRFGMEVKAKMNERGLVTAFWEKCPRCGKGPVMVRLAGRKKHLRMRCTTPNCIELIE
jgi:ribosomal protein S27AE